MENASKALLIAVEVLIGILLLSLTVYLINMAQNFSEQIDGNIETRIIQEFNAKFEAYNHRNDLTPQDIVTLSNIVKDYNSRDNVYKTIKINISGVNKYKAKIEQGLTKDKAIEFMTEYAPQVNGDIVKQTRFTCVMNYDSDNGNINYITLTLNK